MSSRPSSHRTSEIPNGISPPSVFINLARKSPNLPLVVSSCTMLSMCTPATCHLFLFMGFWPPFNSPFLFWTFGYREFDTLDPSLMSSQSLNFRIPIFRAVKTLLHYSFAFRDFKDSDMECYAFVNGNVEIPMSEMPTTTLSQPPILDFSPCCILISLPWDFWNPKLWSFKNSNLLPLYRHTRKLRFAFQGFDQPRILAYTSDPQTPKCQSDLTSQ
jgi:hypothetical protein